MSLKWRLLLISDLPKEYDLASEDPAVRANGVKYLTDILRAMKKIGSKSLVGAMYSYWPCKDFKYDDKEGAWERSIQGMKEVAKVAEELDIECCLEFSTDSKLTL